MRAGRGAARYVRRRRRYLRRRRAPEMCRREPHATIVLRRRRRCGVDARRVGVRLTGFGRSAVVEIDPRRLSGAARGPGRAVLAPGHRRLRAVPADAVADVARGEGRPRIVCRLTEQPQEPAERLELQPARVPGHVGARPRVGQRLAGNPFVVRGRPHQPLALTVSAHRGSGGPSVLRAGGLERTLHARVAQQWRFRLAHGEGRGAGLEAARRGGVRDEDGLGHNASKQQEFHFSLSVR